MAKIRSRARTVDMLGRQQIAGTQNAINELFKNAHDAYAKHARIDFFEDEGTLVIRDDGVGMTREDFEEKWLVLGTESKTGDGRTHQFKPPGMPRRPITGEKGIGRLAIALLGRQVLVLTRAVREGGADELVIGLVHWGMFEYPGLNLEDIDVPVETIGKGELPTAQHVEKLKSTLVRCVERLKPRHPKLNFNTVLKDLVAFKPDPIDLDAFFAASDEENLSLKGKSAGTHFIIAPTNPVLALEIAAEDKHQDYSFRKQLLGFTDEAFTHQSQSRISTSFQRWQAGAVVGEELLGAETFFTWDELANKSDHLLTGSVDEFGQFRGSLRVYENPYPDVLIPWAADGKKTECGPFSIIFGYLMGREAESLQIGDSYRELNHKLDQIGGLYVYRDGVRILPYGDFSFDWLEVEKRRSKGAGYYFFSYRRMFGAVSLSRNDNELLQEKAGREGFQTNRAYRQLREILTNILEQLAAEFFRSNTGDKSELFEKTKEEMRRRAESLERQQKRSTEKRKRFAKALETFETSVAAGVPQAAVDSLRDLTRARMEAASKIVDQDKAAAALIRAEREAVTQLNVLRERFTCKKPSGVALNKDLTRTWDFYRTEKLRLDKEVFSAFEEEIATTLGSVAKQARLYIDQRQRLEERIQALAQDRQRQLQEAVDQARDTASDTRKTVFDITQKAMIALDSAVKQIQTDLHTTDLTALSPKKIEELRKAWEEQLTEIETRHRDALMAARDMLAALAENLRTSGGEEPAQIMEALEERMLALEEEADENFEMVQLGLAVAIINHEFGAAIRNVRRSVQALGQVSRNSLALRPLYQSIRTNFEHLDGHLKLFTPLQRRLYRTAQSISGKNIRNYVNDLFTNRFERHKVTLDCTPTFLNAIVECYPSTLYPAFINLIDNALFWLATTKGERVIQLDVVAHEFVIANTGPAIDERDQGKIFERGFSRRPGGRGLGLFISARALRAEKMTLFLAQPPKGFGVAFHIAAPSLTLG